MRILSHRGYWVTPEEKNSVQAFRRSFSRGFGTETDVRDCAGRLVISHDAPSGDELPLSEFLDIFCQFDTSLPLAVNIKSDGIAGRVCAEMAKRGIQNWFTFDMSIPDTVVQLRLGVPAFLRRSEYEPENALFAQASGVWLDAFKGCWYTEKDIGGYLEAGKTVCIVSPELHGRATTGLWPLLKASGLSTQAGLFLCTDVPEEAVAYFLKDGA